MKVPIIDGSPRQHGHNTGADISQDFPHFTKDPQTVQQRRAQTAAAGEARKR